MKSPQYNKSRSSGQSIELNRVVTNSWLTLCFPGCKINNIGFLGIFHALEQVVE